MISGPTRAEKGDILIHVFTQKKNKRADQYTDFFEFIFLYVHILI